MDGGKDWLEAILKRKAYGDSPVKVIKIETVDSGIGKGENYLSIINRVKAKVLLGSGKVKTLSFILKNQHETEQMKKFSLETGVFFREITMYRDILPKMQNLLEEIGDCEDLFWPKCYDIRLYNRLLFEDLGVLGYKMAERKKQLGLDASLLVIRYLAKFHALSRILIERGEIPINVFGKPVLVRNREDFMKNTNMNVKNLIKAMEKWGDEWKEVIERFKKAENFAERAMDAYSVEPNEFTVLCHGDCWTNNLLFAGDDLEHPKSVKFLDLQLCFVFSPVKDLFYFLYTSIRQDVRECNFDLILRVYCGTLKTVLLKCGYEGFIPDIDFVKKEMIKKGIIGLLDTICFLPIILLDKKDALDLEDIIQQAKDAEAKGDENFDTDMFNLLKNMSKNAEKIVQAEIKKALANRVI